MKFLTLLPALALALCVAAPAAVAGDDYSKLPGFVDGKKFIEAVGDDAVTVEVSIGGALLSAITKFDPQLHELAGGLKSISAIVLSTEDAGDTAKARSMIRDTRTRLKKEGWEALATIREEGSEVQVLVLNDDEAIQGLVVMVADENEIVFANLAGVLDLAAIVAIGEGLDLPGLDVLEDLELDDD
jgi:hypothetical protein